jgi:4-hydroxy-tetrahydrodipicolinate synthase
LYVQLYEAAHARRLDEVHDLQTRVMDLSERIYTVGDPATSYFRGLKCALELDGICSGLPAPPLAPFNDAERSQIAAHLQELSGSVAV